MQWCTPVERDGVRGNGSTTAGVTRATEDPSHFGRHLTANVTAAAAFELEFDGVESVKIVASLISLLGCFFILVTYLLFPPLRRYHSNFVLCIALTSMLFHGNVIAQTQEYGSCCVSAPVTQAALLAQEFYFFVLAFNFFYTTKHPFQSTKFLVPFYHAFVWLVAAGSAYGASVITSGSVNSYGYCWFSGDTAHGESVLIYTFTIPVFTGYVLSIGMYVAATKRVRLSAGGMHTKDATTNLDTMRNYLLFSLLYWVIVSVPWTFRHRGWVTMNSPEEKAMRFVGRLLVAFKGLLSAIAWAHVMSMKNAYELWKKGNWDDYMKVHEATWVLRQEILYFATKGIQYSATLAAEQGEVNEDSFRGFSSVSRGSGVAPWYTHQNERPEGPAAISYELQGPHENDHTAIFRDFHPSSFQEIRRMSGISNDSYIQSFSGRTKERFSEGKSGSFLYYTGDQVFILKTCTPAERKYLLAILPKYMAHLRDNPNSYLCRYVGCHELVLAQHSVSFIVLTNILNNTTMNIDEFYDLKGSWVGRFRALTHNGKQRVCKYCGRDFIVGMSEEGCERNPLIGGGHGELLVGKDLNWGGRRLRLPDALTKQLGSQLYADSKFLRHINSMDYSLIIGMSRYPSYSFTTTDEDGINYVEVNVPGPTKRDPETGDSHAFDETPNFFDTTYAQAASPVASRAREIFPTDACVVSMGIIDILTPWSFRKALEHWMRVYFQCQDRSGVSCVNPTVYAQRFRENVVDVVIFGRGTRSHALRVARRRARDNMREGSSKDMISVEFANTNTPILS